MYWTHLRCSGDAPSGRSHAFTCVVGARHFVLGGYSGSHVCDDLFSLDLNNSHWSKVTVRGDPPCEANRHTSMLWHECLQKQEFLVSFGGNSKSQFFRNPIHILDPRTMRWVRNEATWLHGSWPSYAGEHSGKWDLQRGPIVFGADDGEYSNTLQALDMRSMKWMLIHAGGSMVPSPRCLHATAIDEERRRMVVFGGFDGTYLNDLYSLDLDTCAFTQHHGEGQVPKKVSGAQIAVEDDSVTVHGGVGCSGIVTHHVYKMDFAVNKWEHQRSSVDLPRTGHSFCSWRPGMRPNGFRKDEGHLMRWLAFGGHDGEGYTADVHIARYS